MSMRAVWDIVRKAPLKDLVNPNKLRLFYKVWPFTMVGYRRLANAHHLAGLIEEKGLEGAIVECGVWKGGCSAVMAHQTTLAGSKRNVWLFDSFQGLPVPTMSDGDKACDLVEGNATGALAPIGKCEGTYEDVRRVFFDVLDLPEERVKVVQGWFQDTLPEHKSTIDPIALLRLDGDWYESTKVCLDNLYDKVVSGGYIIIDDYGHWEGCRRAVDEFFEKHGINVDLVTIDETGCYFKKP